MKPTDPRAMSIARLTALLEAYGGQPARWPEAERSLALALLATDPEAQRLQREASALDAALDGLEPPAVSAQLRARVLEVPIRHARPQRGWAMQIGRYALFALVPCILGFLSGALSAGPTSQGDGWQEVSALTLLTDVSEEDWP